MKHTLHFITIALTVIFSATAMAADQYSFDKSHTNVLMKLSHLGFSSFYLEVRDYDGSFVFDADNPVNSSVNVSFKAASIDGDHQKLNQHLQSADFFEVEKFPTITFSSTAVKVEDGKIAAILGDLTIKGVTREVELATKFNKAGVHPFNDKYIAGFSANTVIKRSEFGIEYGLPAIGDDVEIIIEVEGIRQ